MNRKNEKSALGRRKFLALAPTGAVAAAAGAALLDSETRHDTRLSQDALPPLVADSYLTDAEKALVSAVFDRLIPADDAALGASDAGCVAFLDRQLAGPWGLAATRYRAGPFKPGTPEQGDQSPFTPRERYRSGLKALETRCTKSEGKGFAQIAPERQDAFLQDMEAGRHGPDGKAFFEMMLQNVREGYFADPLYGGNKGMTGWKLVGFPGARYDYRAEIDRPGADLGLAPISLMDRG
ncbi:gluconate 2-dehydrogenase subunit 3 family protein [Novosphingobium sp. 1949]|uniref:Gluconate 2-dehydrogenase subunit 3 family protein n=1 Tax=Novosphingobium organovorum TaxID=2930092 RepID=A0ABT0B8F1_9SPHN|nr:gluconate 2-dehydrogenase subunit 3 family protein [Novosphingobium organovorum]MCJ2181268.1 gluconate 2-dehydrogenase subunit 3 family protein [Novosphingobium organovorum]